MTTGAQPVPAIRVRSRSRSRRARAATVLTAVLAPTAIWVLAVPLLGVQLHVPSRPGQPPLQVGLPAVVGVSLAASLAAWGLLALLERRTRCAGRTWRVAAVAVLAASLAGPLRPGVATATRIVLVLMHLAVAAVLIPSLARGMTSTPSQPAA